MPHVLGDLGEEERIGLLLLDEGHGGGCQEGEDEGGGLEVEALGEDCAGEAEPHDQVGVAVD